MYVYIYIYIFIYMYMYIIDRSVFSQNWEIRLVFTKGCHHD